MPEEVELQLGNRCAIYSGWIDHDDPDALECGGYIRVEDPQSRELLYVEASDFAGLTTDEAAAKLCELIRACQGQRPEARDPPDPQSTKPGPESD